MEQTTLKDRLDQAHAKKVAWILEELTREELTEARDNPELWMYAANIASEAARRYFEGDTRRACDHRQCPPDECQGC